MNENEEITKNQHYVPCCVLKYFKESDDVFNKDEKRIFHVIHRKKQSYPSTINKVMSDEMFYENDKLPINFFEEELRKFEKLYSIKVEEMVKSIDKYESNILKFSDTKNFLFTMISDIIKVHLRSGAMMYELNYWDEKKLNSGVFVMINKIYRQNYSLRYADALVNFYDFCIIKSYNKNFFISDQFIATASLSFKGRFSNATNRNVGMKDTIVLFPISKSYYLCFYNGNKPSYIKDNQFIYLSKEQTDEINSIIMNNSYVQTCGPYRADLNNALIKYDSDSNPSAIYYGGGKYTGGAELRKEVFFYYNDKLVFDFISDPRDITIYTKCQKNDICPCGSGKLFGNCCRYKVREFYRFMNRIELESKNSNHSTHCIPYCNFHEENIYEFCVRSKK